MTINDFVTTMTYNLLRFHINMDTLGLGSMSDSEWMRAFLKWLEWETEEHDQYWEDN